MDGFKILLGFVVYAAIIISANSIGSDPAQNYYISDLRSNKEYYGSTYEESSPYNNESEERIVIFNQKTHKVHDPDCQWANACTVNCIKVTEKEAYEELDGIPCKICGG
jgi:hypothetical protein